MGHGILTSMASCDSRRGVVSLSISDISSRCTHITLLVRPNVAYDMAYLQPFIRSHQQCLEYKLISLLSLYFARRCVARRAFSRYLNGDKNKDGGL